MCNRIEDPNYCRCDAQGYVLCNVPMTRVANELKCNGKTVSQYGRLPGVKTGVKCSGYYSDIKQESGEYQCDACPGEGMWFTGQEGGTCKGTHRHSGNPYEGTLRCGRRR